MAQGERVTIGEAPSPRVEIVGAGARHALAVARAAYALDLDEEAWLKGVLDAARPAFDGGFGLHGASFRLVENGRWELDAAVFAPGGGAA